MRKLFVWYSVSHLLFSYMLWNYEAGWTSSQDLCLHYFTCYYQFYQFSMEEMHSYLSGSLFHYSYYVFLTLLGNNPARFQVECLVMAYKILAESALLVSTAALCYYCPISHSLTDFNVSLPFPNSTCSLNKGLHWATVTFQFPSEPIILIGNLLGHVAVTFFFSNVL